MRKSCSWSGQSHEFCRVNYTSVSRRLVNSVAPELSSESAPASLLVDFGLCRAPPSLSPCF